MKTVAERVNALESLNESNQPNRALELGKALNDRSPTIRGLAIELIGDSQFFEMLPQVMPLIVDRDAEVRALAIECIAKLMGDDFPVKTIAECLFDKDELVRVAAAEAFAEHGNVSVLSDLHKALNDTSPLVRSYVAEAIGAIGNQKSITILEKCLQKEKDERATLGYYVGLSQIDKRNVLQNLIDLFQSDDYRVRSAVINSLDQIRLERNGAAVVSSFLKEVYQSEKTVAVKSSIQKALISFSK